MSRVFLIVIDACGIGAMSDWKDYNDPPGANTFFNSLQKASELGYVPSFPNLERVGLFRLAPEGLFEQNKSSSIGIHGRAKALSPGKDTCTGHWEMTGLILDKPFPLYPQGFPSGLLDLFIRQTHCGDVLCNMPYSGTDVIQDFGDIHCKTGYPIIYTSADSVLQIATHVDVVKLETLYHWCHVARELCIEENEVSRVIARPFQGETGAFTRMSEFRKDLSIKPYKDTLLSFLQQNGVNVVSIGKIADIFSNQGISQSISGKSNRECLNNITNVLEQPLPSNPQFIFANLVETDSHFGHRNNPVGFVQAVEEIDSYLGRWLGMLQQNDLLIITADHGCDPTVPGTDHTREEVPILAYSRALETKSIGVRSTFADNAATIADYLGLGGKWIDNNFPGVSYI